MRSSSHGPGIQFSGNSPQWPTHKDVLSPVGFPASLIRANDTMFQTPLGFERVITVLDDIHPCEACSACFLHKSLAVFRTLHHKGVREGMISQSSFSQCRKCLISPDKSAGRNLAAIEVHPLHSQVLHPSIQPAADQKWCPAWGGIQPFRFAGGGRSRSDGRAV